MAEAFQHPVLVSADPEWNCRTKAFGRFTPFSETEFPWFEQRFDKGLERTLVQKRNRDREYGMMNFGDWYGERSYNWGNMEYDTPFVLLVQYLRRGDPALFEFGQQAARHNTDVDTIHYHSDLAQVGGVKFPLRCRRVQRGLPPALRHDHVGASVAVDIPQAKPVRVPARAGGGLFRNRADRPRLRGVVGPRGVGHATLRSVALRRLEKRALRNLDTPGWSPSGLRPRCHLVGCKAESPFAPIARCSE